jgi:Fe-S cluster assembly protein SufD
MSTALADRISREHAAVAAVLPSAVVSDLRRQAALEEIRARGLPSGRDENWRYANLRALERTSFAPPTGDAATATPEPGLVLPPAVPGFSRFLIIDGVLRDLPAGNAAALAGVSLSSARATAGGALPLAAGRAASETEGDQRFALVNEAFALDELGIITRADPLADAAGPGIELLYVSSGRGAAYPRIRIEVTAGTQLRVLERHLGGSATTLTSGVTAVSLARDARFDHYRLQAQSSDATWIDTLEVTLGQHAHYALHQYAVGARSARSTIRIRLGEPQASVVFHAATIAESVQVGDTDARIEHAAPHTRSIENFRAIATARGRVAFNGHVIVRPGAHGADSKQSLRSLIAGPDAEVDARPQLEIYTDDVQCRHGATAGKLDETMLFYMLSRGLARDTAQSLLKWAFLADTVAHIGDGPLRATIEELLAAHLKDPTIAAGRRE